MTRTTMTAEEREADKRERNRKYQEDYRNRMKAQDAQVSSPTMVKNSPELDELYERKEELEVELDMVTATIRFKEHKNRVLKEPNGEH